LEGLEGQGAEEITAADPYRSAKHWALDCPAARIKRKNAQQLRFALYCGPVAGAISRSQTTDSVPHKPFAHEKLIFTAETLGAGRPSLSAIRFGGIGCEKGLYKGMFRLVICVEGAQF
jgi:hypothetical protein